MPDSLMDMFGGFQPRSLVDPQQSVGYGDALQQRSNSLIGLGMALMSPRRPGESAYGNALGGYMQGAQADTANAYRQAQLQHQKSQDAFQRSQAAQAQQNWEKQFARGDLTEAQKAYRDIYGAGGTPEQKQAFMAKYYEPKTEGDWAIAQAPHPTYPGETVPVWANKRTQEVRPFNNPPGGVAAPNPFAGAVNPLAPGATAQASPTGGVGGVSYDNAGAGMGGFGSVMPDLSYRGGSGAPATAALPADGIPPAPPGSDPKEWRKEQTKLRVQQQTAAEAAKRAGASIDPVSEDIDRSIAQISQYPKMTTGAFATALKKIPIVGGATQAGEVESLINTVKASSSLEKLQQMRAQSPTGASGLGAVTQGEHKLLQDAIGSLDQSQDAASVLYNLERVKRIRHEIIHGPGTAPPPRFAPPSYQQTPDATSGAAPRPGFVKGGYVFKGGDPSDQSNWAPVR